MPEPFKNLLDASVIQSMGKHFSKAWPDFNQKGFVRSASKNLKTLELKQRSVQIMESMHTHFPEDYEQAATIILDSLSSEENYDFTSKVNQQGIVGWAVMVLADYVGQHGLKHFDLSMTVFKELTKRASSEFGIRPFLLQETQRTLTVLDQWAEDPNHHVRRLVSEGTRTRLPWAMRLPVFIDDPALVISLLEKLQDDPEEYVRRSVANNLNDISKDHPDLVAKIAKRWLKGKIVCKEKQRLVRHACRSLIKQGHQKTLKALGYGIPKVELDHLEFLTPEVHFGKALEFELQLDSNSKKDQPLIIDYIIHHRKANGSTSPKVFKWKTITLKAEQSLTATRKHSMRKITTRVYYPGIHSLEIVINGVIFDNQDFELIM